MNYLPTSQLPLTDEKEVPADIIAVFDDIQRGTGAPVVTNLWLALAGSRPALAGTWDVMRQVYLESSLPLSLKAMILYSIAANHQCQYCSAVHEVTCRTLGVDEAMLEALAKDFERLNPRRVQEIIKFAIKCANDAPNLTEADYDHIREQGITEEELVEIISLAALGNYLDTVADGLKIEVDSLFVQALEG